MSMLEVKGLQKAYVSRFGGNRVEALKNVNFTVEEGEYVAIMGESGSGKTTLLNIIGGLTLDEPAADLAAILALASSYLDKPIGAQVAAIGEVGLTGELRNVNNLSQRLSEVRRLGFTECIIPKQHGNRLGRPDGLKLTEVQNVGEALRVLARS